MHQECCGMMIEIQISYAQEKHDGNQQTSYHLPHHSLQDGQHRHLHPHLHRLIPDRIERHFHQHFVMKQGRRLYDSCLPQTMLATATCATAQNGKFPTSGVCADSVQTEKDSIKANQEAEIKTDKEAEIQAVTVTGHRPMYKMRNDALVTRVRNTPLAKEPTLEDVLKHIPGMKQTADGTLKVNGLGAPIIYLNDKKATSAELSHLDVKLIDEIELNRKFCRYAWNYGIQKP